MRFVSKRFAVFITFSFLTFLSSFLHASEEKRIISLAPSVTEMVYALNAGSEIVGVTSYCLYPEDAKSKPKVGGFTDHNLEAIVDLKPDLVLMNPNQGTKLTYEKLKQLHIAAEIMPVDRLDDLIHSFELAGKILGREEKGSEWANLFRQRIIQIKKKAQSRPSQTVAFVVWRKPLMVPGASSLEQDVIELAGGKNIVDQKVHYLQMGLEPFIETNPDIIIDASFYMEREKNEGAKRDMLEFWKRYPFLKAVKNGKLYTFKEDVFSVPGPKTLQFMEAIDALLDPKGEEISKYYESIQI